MGEGREKMWRGRKADSVVGNSKSSDWPECEVYEKEQELTLGRAGVSFRGGGQRLGQGVA